MISLLSLAVASPIVDAVDELVAVTGWDESSPLRMRPSTIRARLEQLAPSCPLPVVTTYTAGQWDGTVNGHAARGSLGDHAFTGTLTAMGTPVSDGQYDSQGHISAHIAGSPVVGVYIREQGTTGALVALGGCPPDILLAGQSNTARELPAAVVGTPITSGTLYADDTGVPATVFPSRLGPAWTFLDSGYTVVRHWEDASRITAWIDGLMDEAITRAQAAGRQPSITLWVQGESDRRTLQRATRYADRFEQLAAQVETDLGPQLFVWPEIHPSQHLHANIVNGSMAALAASRDDLVVVPTEDLARPDGVHYAHSLPRESGSAYQLGQRMLEVVDVWSLP